MKKVIYKHEGKLWVLTPVENCGLTLEQVISKDVPSGAIHAVVDSVPEDRTFREAWKFSETGVQIDIPVAKEIWKNKWREARKKKFASLDVAFMRALEAGDTDAQADIAEQKEALRDVTLTPINGNTPEEIKAVWPEILN